MNSNILIVTGLVLMLSLGPMLGRFYQLDRPRLPDDHEFIVAGAIWTLGVLLLIMGLTGPVP